MLQSFRFPLVFAGAGLSRASGVPEPPRADLPRFLLDRAACQAEYRIWRQAVAGCHPHAGHAALLRLQTERGRLPVITSTMDGLLQRSGLREVAAVHGNALVDRCLRCAAPAGECVCAGDLRPDVVWDGEDLQEVDRAREWLAQADCIICLGWSALPQPVGEWPLEALRRGVHGIEINPAETPLSAHCQQVLRLGAEHGVARLLEISA